MSETRKTFEAGQDVTIIIELNRRINHDDIGEVTRTYEQIMERDMLQSAVGNTYVKKLARIMRREGKGNCLYCDSPCAIGKVLCPNCYQQNSTKEAVNETLALVEDIQHIVTGHKNYAVPQQYQQLSNVQPMMPQQPQPQQQAFMPQQHTYQAIPETQAPNYLPPSVKESPYAGSSARISNNDYSYEQETSSYTSSNLRYGSSGINEKKGVPWGLIAILGLIAVAVIALVVVLWRGANSNEMDYMEATADFTSEEITELNYVDRLAMVIKKNYFGEDGKSHTVSFEFCEQYGGLNEYQLVVDDRHYNCGVLIICDVSGHVEGVWSIGKMGDQYQRVLSGSLLHEADPNLSLDDAYSRLDFLVSDERNPYAIGANSAFAQVSFPQSQQTGILITTMGKYDDVYNRLLQIF